MSIARLTLVLLAVCIDMTSASHFRGGTITWRPYNNTPSGGTADIIVRERYSWRLDYPTGGYNCTAAYIAANGMLASDGPVYCVSGNCVAWNPLMDTKIYCTDFSNLLDVSSGEWYQTYTVPIGIQFSICFSNSAWLLQLVIGSSSAWYVTAQINTAIRPDGFLNTSPIAVSLPIIYKQVNIQYVHVVQMSDFDGTDTLRCRWSTSSTSNTNSYDECGGACNGVPGAVLFPDNCTLVFTLTSPTWYYAVALQIEDFFNSTITTPMSSVPLQFLFYCYAAPTGCSTPPLIYGVRPNRACIGTPIGSNVTEYVLVQTFCPGQPIIDFVTSAPVYMTKSGIITIDPFHYELILSWIPQFSQYGPQPFCAGAIDSSSLQSNQWCITYLVGFDSPTVVRPSAVQGSASPIGTVFQNQTVFSIDTSISVGRPSLNGTFIHFTDSTTNTTVVSYDCGWAPEVTYTGYTIVIRFPVAPWTPGHFYYVTFDDGVASGTDFCGPESAAITDPTFWVFNIWDPAVSSTTTTTTAYPSTHTVTTLGLSTSTTNPNLTTTGIVITTTTAPPTTTTTSTTTTSSTTPSTTAGPTASGATTESTVGVMYPKDFENACQQPILIMTIVTMAAMVPLNVLAMYTTFTKISSIFKPSNIEAQLRHKQRMKNILRR